MAFECGDRYKGGEASGYFVARSPSYVNLLILREFLVDGKPDAARQTFRDGLQLYPLAQGKNPPAMQFINGSTKAFNTVHANTLDFYEELARVIAKEPVDFVDVELRGLVVSEVNYDCRASALSGKHPFTDHIPQYRFPPHYETIR